MNKENRQAIDAVIDLEWTRKPMPEAPDDFSVSQRTSPKPPISSCTSRSREMVIRPFGEKW